MTKRVALVTGAGRGMGRAHAHALAQNATVIVNDLGGDSRGESRDSRPAEAVAAEINAAGGQAVADFTDISDWSDAQRLIDGLFESYGRLDVLINNAGVSRNGTFGSLQEDDWKRQFAVNVKGPTALINRAANHWKSAEPARRSIINTSSPAGVHPVPAIAVYSSTKAAIASLTISAARDLAPYGVSVNGVVPIARTRLIDHAPKEIQEYMRPREGFDPFLPDHVSKLVAYLASEECVFTGRLFGAQGDQVYLFREWSAEQQVDNGGSEWTYDEMVQKVETLPRQETYWDMVAGGRVEGQSPSLQFEQSQ